MEGKTLLGLGIFTVGAIIGSFVTNKINEEMNGGNGCMNDLNEFLKDMLLNEIKKNEKLRDELDSLKRKA